MKTSNSKGLGVIGALVCAICLALFLGACVSKQTRKLSLDPETRELLKSPKNLVVSGKTGEIKGTSKDKNPNCEICKGCNFPKGSLRQFLCLQICADPDFDPKLRELISSNQDIILNGKTGNIGTSIKNRGLNRKINPTTNFPMGSVRDRILMYDEP